MSRVLVTGGAGFIGHGVLSQLIARGGEVVAFDNLSTAEPDWDQPFRSDILGGQLRFVRGDILDLDAVLAAMADVDLVVHLAASTDIGAGFADPSLDFQGCVVGTWNVAEAMRRMGARRILYASSGVVYGPVDDGQGSDEDLTSPAPTAESHGPLRPESHYAAGKLAGEAILSGFAHLYGWRALAFRFGNTVGPQSNHGVVHDFVAKLLRDPSRLDILGDGRQAKPYLAMEDIARAMLHAEAAAPDLPFGVYNVGTEGVVTVDGVADLVIEALGLDRETVERRYSGPGGGWRGDTERVEFDMSALLGLGWRPVFTAAEALKRAAVGSRARLLAAGPPYRTSFERRAAGRTGATRTSGPGRVAGVATSS